MLLAECHLVLAETLGTGAVDDLLSSKYVVPFAFLGVAAILLLRRPRKSSGIPTSVAAARAMTGNLNTQERIRRDIETLMVELQELSRKISADIDVRFAKLELVIRDADRRIAALNRLVRESGQSSPSPENSNEPDIRHQIVYELADAGKKAIEIARELGKTPGEVELILNLRGKTVGVLSAGVPLGPPSPAPVPPTESSTPSVPDKPVKAPRAPRERKKTEQSE